MSNHQTSILYSQDQHQRGYTVAHLSPELLQLGILGCHLVNVVSDLSVLRQESFGISQTGGRVLAGHGCLCVRQPFLEMVKVLEEMLEFRGFT